MKTLIYACILGFSLPAVACGSGVRDDARMFKPQAVAEANTRLERIEKDQRLPVTLETVTSLDGEKVLQAAVKRAKALQLVGVFVLISKNDHKIEVLADRKFERVLPIGARIAIRDAFMTEFKESKFDAGLTKGIDAIERVSRSLRIPAGAPAGVERAQVPGAAPKAGGGGGGGWFLPFALILAAILGITFLIKIFGAMARSGRGYGPGNANQMGGPMGGQMGGGQMGGPMGGGYGGRQGGGFLSSLFGGVGGAIAGNWLYDQMSGRHHQSPGAGDVGTPPATTGGDGAGDWSGGQGVSGDWGGGGDGGGAGGDWGGGGGDGGGGGGDGGGGGGDWGGGGGDGGGGGGDWGGGGGGGDGGGSW